MMFDAHWFAGDEAGIINDAIQEAVTFITNK